MLTDFMKAAMPEVPGKASKEKKVISAAPPVKEEKIFRVANGLPKPICLDVTDIEVPESLLLIVTL